LYGYFANSHSETRDGFEVSSEFHILRTIKKTPILAKRKWILLPHYISIPNPKKPPHFILFADVIKGNLDLFAGVEARTEKSVEYLRAAMALDPKDTPKALQYYFRFLDNPDPEVSQDAFHEFANAAYKDLRAAGKKFSADKILKWLQDPKTPEVRYGLYGILLGHCGTAKHARELRKLLRDPKIQEAFGFEGLLIGYMMLQPRAGYAHLCGLLGNSKHEFAVRHAILKTLRFFWETRPDLVAKKDLLAVMDLVLNHPDVADFAIEDLRRWRQWQFADRILALAPIKTYDLPIVRRAILKFALSWPTKDAKAKAFIAEERKKDKEEVEEIEQALKEEAEDKSKR
jgi:hypothetical protein